MSREAILDAAEAILRDEGYAAVSSRKVAAVAGLKSKLVHYYFKTMDDLFLAMFRRRGDEGIVRQAAALASDRPIRALWEFSIDDAGTAMTMEFVALGNHRKVVRSEIAKYAGLLRDAQIVALTAILDAAGVDREEFAPEAVSVLLTSLSRVVVMERALGLTTGHAEAIAVAERFITTLDDAMRPAPTEV